MCSHLAAHTGFCYAARLPFFVLGRTVWGWKSDCQRREFVMAMLRFCSRWLAQPQPRLSPPTALCGHVSGERLGLSGGESSKDRSLMFSLPSWVEQVAHIRTLP